MMDTTCPKLWQLCATVTAVSHCVRVSDPGKTVRDSEQLSPLQSATTQSHRDSSCLSYTCPQDKPPLDWTGPILKCGPVHSQDTEKGTVIWICASPLLHLLYFYFLIIQLTLVLLIVYVLTIFTFCHLLLHCGTIWTYTRVWLPSILPLKWAYYLSRYKTRICPLVQNQNLSFRGGCSTSAT